MNNKLFLIVSAVVFQHVKELTDAAACNDGERHYECDDKTTICYGGATGITSDDVLCMLGKSCDQSYREDACLKCDEKQYKNNSRYMDCTGACYNESTMDGMKKVDVCGVCDGNNKTCSPSVTSLDVSVLPNTANITFNITGKSMVTKDIQILLLKSNVIMNKREAPNGIETQEAEPDVTESHKVVKRRANKVVKFVLEIVKVYTDTKLEIRVQDIVEGQYEVGARTGDDGEEYLDHTGPKLIVYSGTGYAVDEITPTEQDIDGTAKVTVALKLTASPGLLSLDTVMVQTPSCFYSSSTDVTFSSETQSSVLGAYLNNKLECALDIPEVSKAIWVCPSFNKIHLLACRSITFYEKAPKPVKNKLTFMNSGQELYVDFDKAVESQVKTPCSTYFTDTSTLGAGPKCYLDDTGQRLIVMLGEGSSAGPGNTLELKAGLKPREGIFKRESEAFILTIEVADDVDNHIMIAKVGSWPEKLTSVSENPITLEIEVVQSPGGRPQKSITWTVNGDAKEAAKDQFVLQLDVTNVGQYVISVTATDFLGGSDNIVHTIVKEDVDLPNVVFSSSGIKQGIGSRYIVYPNAIFTLSASLTYPEGTTQNDFTFQWTRNGEDVPGLLTYRSATNETTIEMCGADITLSLKVSSASNQGKSIVYSLKVHVLCRNPIAKIAGHALINVDVRSDDVKLYGSSSKDPDGGILTYAWTCSTLGNTKCIGDVTSNNDHSKSTVIISPSKMKAGKKYAIFLTVGATKSGVLYNNTARVEFDVQTGNRPVIRWVTRRTRFRHDVPIMMRAYVGKDVTVSWKFRDDLSLYEYIDANNKSVGKSKMTDDGFAWYRINQDVLEPGKQYKLHINVTKTGTEYFSTDEHDIDVYKNLRGCSIEIGPITEFEEATLSLRNCIHDRDVSWKAITCFEGDRDLQISKQHSFIVPRFKSNIEKIVLNCKIMDNFGHTMSAEPKEVIVRKAPAEKTMEQMVEGLKQTGDKVKALALIAEMSDDEDDNGESLNTKAVELMKDIVSSDPSIDDINRSLNSYGKLKVNKMKENDKYALAEDLISMLDKLCRAEDDETSSVTFDIEQTKHILRNTKRLMANNPKTLGKLYRKAEEKMACIKFKRMKNEDSEIIEDEDGTKHAYLVNVLEDLPQELGIEFPEELKEKYRDNWICKEPDSCFGVALKLEDHPNESPDFLQFKRADNGCRRYLILTLYNPETGEPIDVHNLEGPINLNFGSDCKRGKCWYRDEALERFSQDGLTTSVGEDGGIRCHTKHLTAFTMESEPELYTGWNFPYIISLCVGAILLLISLVILVKLWLVTKHRANAVEDEKHFALDEVPMSRDDSPIDRKKIRDDSPFDRKKTL